MNKIGAYGVLAALGLVAAASSHAVEVKTGDGIKFASDDGAFEFDIDGRIQVDLQLADEDEIEYPSQTEFRRARLAVEGVVYEDYGYKLQYDVADDDLSLKDAYITYQGFEYGDIFIGQFKQPFSLEELTSSKYITFTERSLPVETVATSRRIGLGWFSGADNWSAAASAYGQEAGNEQDGDEGFGVGVRGTFAPIAEKDRVVHLGAAVNWEETEDTDLGFEDEGFRFRARPDVHRGPRAFDTGLLPASSATKYGLEFATVFGPFSFQAEYIGVDTDLNDDDDQDFEERFEDLESGDVEGWYAFASWFLTGESRPYSASSGVFKGVDPINDYGAFELAVRYDTVEQPDADVTNEVEAVTLAANWYVNKYIRIWADYIMAQDTNGDEEDEPNFFVLRTQVFW
ncbi:MAG: porin [Pseudomonadota bacterium]|nr:porin [Pseudomonadota bacterium]